MIVLIHNAGGNRTFMEKQARYFQQLGYRILNVDLPGHGNSNNHHMTYSIDNFAHYIIALLKNENINAAAFVGLNYGANVAIQIANFCPELVSHLVVMDPPILMEQWVTDLVRNHIQELRDPNIENFAENLVNGIGVFMNSADKEIAISAFNNISKETLALVYEDLLVWDKDSIYKLSNCHMPMLHIQSQDPFCSEISIKTICPQVITARVVGAGHWVTIEAADQVNAMIERFMDISLGQYR